MSNVDMPEQEQVLKEAPLVKPKTINNEAPGKQTVKSGNQIQNKTRQNVKEKQAERVKNIGSDILEKMANNNEATIVNDHKNMMSTEKAEEAINTHIPEDTEIELATPNTSQSKKRNESQKDNVISSDLSYDDTDKNNDSENVVLDTEYSLSKNDDDDSDETAISLISVKGASRVATNSYIKSLKKFNPNPDEIVIEDLETMNQDFQKAYIESRNNLLSAPRAVRVPFLMSGYHADMSAFSHSDTTGLSRQLSNGDYLQRFEFIINTIYEHILSTSVGDISFEEWIKITKMPDLESGYFGLHHATWPGIQKYRIRCFSCNGSFSLDVDNDDLAYISGKFVREQDVKTIMSGNDSAIRKTLLWKKANPEKPLRHRTNDTKIVFEFSIPSIEDYINTLRALQSSDKFEDIANIEDPSSPEFPFLRVYPYINRVAFPIIRTSQDDETKKIVNYRGSYSREIVVGAVNNLSSAEFDGLFEGQDVVDIINMNSIRYAIKPTKCPHCNSNIRAVPVNLQNTFFTRVRETSSLD